MERKIGEIFKHKGEWYQCCNTEIYCPSCAFFKKKCNSQVLGECGAIRRTDGKNAVFKKLEKVGESIQGFQRYKLAVNKVTYNGKDRRVMVSMPSKTLVYIEIKQTKEDMEEKKDNYDGNMDKECIPLCDALNSLPNVETIESCCGHCKDRFRIFFKCKNPYSLSVIARVFNRRYSGTKLQWIIEVETHDNGGYDYFVHSVEAYENNTMMEKDISQLVENIKYWSSEKYKEHFINGVTSEEEKKLNLKPFNLQRAKEGKPVCTRDGAKARIICFDAKSDAPIIALVTTDDGTEIAFDYLSDGTFFNSENPDNDLMMLPEKKEGGILLRKDGCVFDNEEVAKKNCTDDYFVAKVEWEE